MAIQVTSFQPTQGPVGTLVTFHGSGFTTDIQVAFHGVFTEDTKVSADGTTCQTHVPTYATSGDITLSIPGEMPESAGNFVVTASMTRMSPNPVAKGAKLTVYGWELTEVSSVRFTGGASATPSSKTQSSLMVKVPSGATSGPITLVTPYGNVKSTSSLSVEDASRVVGVVAAVAAAAAPKVARRARARR